MSIYRFLALGVSVVALAGCETFTEPSIVSSEVLLQETSGPSAGALIREDVSQDFLGGSMYRYWAVNLSPVPVCAKVSLIETSATTYSFVGARLVPSGATVDLGFMDNGGLIEYDLWVPNASGVCGYPPS